MGDTRSRPAVFGKLNRTCRRIEGMTTNDPSTKTRSFQHVAPFFGRQPLVIHILEGIAPQLCLKFGVRRVGRGKSVCVAACSRLEMRRSVDAARCDRQIPKAKTTGISPAWRAALRVRKKGAPQRGARGRLSGLLI